MFGGAFEVAHSAVFAILASGRPAGTAFAISPQGHLATAEHVVQSSHPQPLVAARTLGGYQEFPIRIVRVEPSADIAILKINGVAATCGWLRISAFPASYADSVLVLGYPVTYRSVEYAKMGRPMLNLRVNGCVVASDLTVPIPSGGGLDVFEVDRLFHPGMSGAPVVNLRGEVVGIISHHFFGLNKAQQDLAQAHYTVAIRAEHLRRIAAELIGGTS
ncbi:MAG TPA: serine protease [Terriglobia bacterium]|jgi:S1-C subfamily serine protease|nr:serine protease [Terriglobia bacterium]